MRGLASALVASALLACGPREAEPKQVRGLVVNVAGASVNRLQGFELRTPDGQVLAFRVEGDVGFTPGHVREHMLFGQPVIVTFLERGDALVALRIEDG
jgi:hypothetical protein